MRLVILGASALALLALAGSGTAAYPGSNGKIAFARNGQIYVTNPDGSGTTAVTAPPDANNDAQPAVSPDGRKIAFVSQRGGGRDIWVAGIDGSNPTQLTRDGTDGNPTWSPNGRQIAFDSGRTGLTTTIWVMDADGTNPPRKVVDRYPVSNVEDPAWSPGGTELAYVLSNPAPAIAVASATDGTGERVVAGSDAEWDRDPSWAPDGTAIAYQRTNTSIGQSDIYAVALATNGKTQLTNDAAPDEHPAYSPDGRQIVYASNRGGRSRLIRMGADGSGPIDLTSQTNNPDAADRDPDWGPAMVETPSLSINDISVTEGNSGTTDATFTVSLSAATSTDVSVDYATADGTATAPSDYASTSGTLTIPTGATSRTITVPVVGDTVVEPDETFTVALSNAANATIAKAQGTGTIVNDDSETPPPSLSIDDVSVPEGDAGSTNAVFTISLSAATTKDVSVHYDTADGSATAGSDYTATSGDAVIPLGQTSTTVSVAVLGDTVVEGDETFTVNLSSPSNATLGRAQATGTIVDDDGGPVAAFTAQPNPVGCEAVVSFDGSASSDTNPGHSIVSYDWSFGDGATATGPVVGHAYTTFGSYRATLRVTDDSSPARSDSTSKVIDVSVDRAPKAAAGGPYVIELGDSLSLYGVGASDPDVGCGDSIQSYSWDLNGDGVADATTASPTFSAAELANLGLGVGTHTATLTVTDSFGTSASASAPFEIRQAQVSIAGTSLAEGDSGNTDAALPVTLSFSSTHTVTVDYATADGTATAGSDYMATSGTLTFAPGTTTQTIHVPVTGDTTVEPDETFDVVLSNVSGAALATSRATVTIQNDDRTAISVDDPSVSESGFAAAFTLTLSNPSASAVTVDVSTADGTAIQPLDYQAVAQTVTFAPRETSKVVTVPIVDDTLDEDDETFVLVLSNAVGASIATPRGMATILDDDPTPLLSVSDVTVQEGDSGTTNVTFLVSLSAASGRAVSVQYATADGTATAPSDYTAASGTLTLAAGSTVAPVTVSVNGDTTVEPDETFVLQLFNPVNATLAKPNGTATIVNDDSYPPAVVSVTENVGVMDTVTAVPPAIVSILEGIHVTDIPDVK